MKKFKELVKRLNPVNLFFLTIAGIINAFGVTVFLAPVKLYDSGISGTSMLISQVTPEWCSLSLILILLNIPIFSSGIKARGKKVYCIFNFYSIDLFNFRLAHYRCSSD